ncbi:o-succinylbenzoate synthase [Bacillus marasmi]|uniref:o-succinylbenzoate synthase n=1 Tax=Bacillus marasmi TaxID=1926279 RepID=UPI0011C8E411|nr:o-succinylbenzoate synthase [Bacillus marasmi]
MNIHSISLYVISKSLKFPFATHLETVVNRESIIVELTDSDGLQGYGEVVAFSSPWYTEETVKTAYHMLKDFFIPLLKNNPVQHPEQVTPLLNKYRRNEMAKAGLETAYWDLYAKRKQVSLSSLLGGTKTEIPSGVVVATSSLAEAYRQIEGYLEDGYKRIKIKISPGSDVEMIEPIRKRYPSLAIMADANSAYTLEDVSRLQALDSFGLLMIEQPLAHDDIIQHAKLQQQIKTPICLDESIVTYEDARNAIELGSCKVLNLKIGRVGGLRTAKAIHDLAVDKGIQVWVGGMVEYGVSRAHNIALASLPGFTIPGDISASSRYWEEDITLPEVVVENGHIKVPTGAGIGFTINEKSLTESTLYRETIFF